MLLTLTIPSWAASGSWNGVAFTEWNGIAQTGWNGTGISCAGGGGGGAGPFTHIATAVGTAGGSGITTVSTSTALNLQAGDLVVVGTSWQSGVVGNTVAVDENDGTDVFTTTPVSISDDLGWTFNYLLSAPADASFTVRSTISASARRLDIVVFQYRPTTAPATLDASTTPATGTGVAASSGTLSTSLADTVVVGGGSNASGTTSLVTLIGGIASDGTANTANGWGHLWYRILTATASNIAATETVPNDFWATGIIAFK